MTHPYRTPGPPLDRPDGTIFEAEEGNSAAEAVNKYLQNLDLSAREQIKFLTQMIDSVVAENNALKEQLLQKQNELDQERGKKLQSG